MNRYQQGYPYVMKDESSQLSSQQQQFQTQKEILSHIQNQEQHDNHYLPSVQKFLSQPNPLMNKIQFTPYHPKCYYPRQLIKLPKCLRDFDCTMTEKNNMNLLSEIVHTHNRMKKDVVEVLVDRKKKQSEEKVSLVTLEEYYTGKEPIYERYSGQEMKLETMKLKLRYFATYVLDMAKILRKQAKYQQKQQFSHLNTQANTAPPIHQIRTRPASVAKCDNFSTRQRKLSNPLTQLSNPSQLQKVFPSNKSHSSRIQFESNFESGNLFRVYEKQFNQYDLVLQNDINTKGNTQWFFFSVKNVPKNTIIKFNIVNLSKSSSLFNIGMKPYVFSMMRYEKRKVGWLREALKVSYQESQVHRKESSKRPYFVLSFEYKFLLQGDVVYFSHSIPYTLSDLSHYLSLKLKDKCVQKLVRQKNVGLTLGSNQVDLLQITNSQYVNKSKKSVWILARQHPGETTSGFMLEGIIDFLLSQNEQSKTLLNNFIFKIVPMVNVDGVIHGNSRAQFIGHDPNRRWSSPNKLHNPIIYSLKHYIQRERDNIELVLDLHSHSRKLGTFFYGNTLATNTAATRMFPLVVCKNDTRFTFNACRFAGGSNKAARSALCESTKIPFIYTVQSSFYGYQQGDFRIVQYLPNDYKEMGTSLMRGFLHYEMRKNKSLKLMIAPKITLLDLERQLLEGMNDEDDKQSVGSERDPEEDEYTEKEFKKLITLKDVKKKKTKKSQKQPEIKIKLAKDQSVPNKLAKPKANNSQSYYKDYFSGRLSVYPYKDKLLDTINSTSNKKQSVSYGVQVNLKYSTQAASIPSNGNILTESNNQQKLIYSKLGGFSLSKHALPNNLCVIGQKVEEISVYGTTVGVQVAQNREITTSRIDQNNPNTARKSFSVRQRINSFLQVKENNFLQRGDYMTKNFFSRR